ncbi:MAG: hypothetical protein M0P63_01010 [Azoarcus sp.]|jgi:hypothetical protein|nr:hypothetical protein [Azoarcus sp.]
MWLPILQMTISVAPLPVRENRRDAAPQRHLKVASPDGAANADSLNLDKDQWKHNVIFLLDMRG